jgi:hypothetical protein
MSSQIFHSGLEMFFNSNPPEESSEVKELSIQFNFIYPPFLEHVI